MLPCARPPKKQGARAVRPSAGACTSLRRRCEFFFAPTSLHRIRSLTSRRTRTGHRNILDANNRPCRRLCTGRESPLHESIRYVRLSPSL